MMKGFIRFLCVPFAFAFFVSFPAHSQSVVKIVSDSSQGLGVAITHDGACFVITPQHIIEGAYEIAVRTGSVGDVDLNLVRTVPVIMNLPNGEQAREDIALLQAKRSYNEVCSGNLTALANERRSVAVITDGISAPSFLLISLLGAPDKELYFSFETDSPGQLKGISGAPIIWGGELAGMVVRLSTTEADQAQVAYGIDLLVKELGEWVIGKDFQIADTEAALSLLEKLRETAPTSELGQSEAVLLLSSTYQSLSGFDFAGMVFKGSNFSGLSFDRANFRVATLSGSNLSNSNLLGADLDFVLAEASDFSGADLSRSSNYFAEFSNANFENSNLRGANLAYAAALNANFVGADLTNANLTYTDLTGANLSGANLTGAILHGAILDGARGLESAIFQNTSITNTSGISDIMLSDEEVCGYRHSDAYNHWVRVVEATPSSYYPSGFAYDDLLEYERYTPHPPSVVPHLYYLRPCPAPEESTELARNIEISKRPGERYASVILNDRRIFKFEHSFLEKQRRRKRLTSFAGERFTAVNNAYFRQRFYYPNTDQDSALAEKISLLETQFKQGSRYCLRPDLTTLRILEASSKSDMRLTNKYSYAQLKELLHLSATANFIGKNRITTAKSEEMEHLLWPFGKAHLPFLRVTPSMSGSLTYHGRLGPSSIAALNGLINKVSRQGVPDLCFKKMGHTPPFLESIVLTTDYSKNPLSVNRKALEAILENKFADALYGNIGGGYVLAIVPRKIPSFFTSEAWKPQPGNGFRYEMKPNDFIRFPLKISDVSLFPDDRLIVVKAEFGAMELDELELAAEPGP